MWSSINMQAIHSSWPGRTFAVPRCSDSREKRTRNRRSKEERKTMVETFIKKYQSSNGGKFPSLNLTHKEVGGSFYTVREIVREIIQENRVLGPGSLTSRSLSLEYFPEEGEESLSMDMSPLSIATINHTVELQKEKQSFLSENSRISRDIIELNESHSVDTFVPQVQCGEHLNDKFSNGNLNGKLASLGYEESNVDKQVEVGDDKVKVHEQKYGEVQLSSSDKSGIDKIEHLSRQAECISPSRGEVVNSDDSSERNNEAFTAFNSSGRSDYFSVSDSLPESKISLDSLPTKEISSQSSVAIKNLDESPKKSEFDTSIEAQTPLEAQISSSEEPRIHKVEVATPLFQVVPKTLLHEIVKGANGSTKNNEITSGFNSPEGSNGNLGSDISVSVSSNSLNPVPSDASDQMQKYSYFKDYSPLPSAATKTYDPDESQEKENEPTSLEVQKHYDDTGFRDKSMPFGMDSILIGSEMPVNEVSAESDNQLVSQNLGSPACESLAQPSLQCNDLENVTTNVKSTSEESILPTANGRIFSEVEAEYKSTLNNADSAKTSASVSKNEANKEAKNPEINPFLTAIRSFLSALIKFWME